MAINLKLQLIGAREARLLEELTFYDGDRFWIAEKGTLINGASIPRIFWVLVGSPFTGYYREAAALHDAYYLYHRNRSRKEVDQMFYEKMLADGVHWFKAKLIYMAVRLGGSSAWQKGKNSGWE